LGKLAEFFVICAIGGQALADIHIQRVDMAIGKGLCHFLHRHRVHQRNDVDVLLIKNQPYIWLTQVVAENFPEP
jgi:hypothetical protein